MPNPNELTQLILDEIKSRGPITFARFMQRALYEPGFGYYTAGLQKFGETGDFVTAPEISPLFARCLANHCMQSMSEIDGEVDIVEFGAGSGQMASDLLLALAKKNKLPSHYYIIEVSAELKVRQAELLKQLCPEYYPKVIWIDDLTQLKKIKGIVIANEVLDAMPVHKFKIQEGQVKEVYVAEKSNELTWQSGDVSTDKLTEAVRSIEKNLETTFPEGYESEVNLFAAPWIQSIYDFLDRGKVVLIDYGFLVHEFYHPERNRGTIMCHYQHTSSDNPLINVAQQDITAHVDFTAVGDAAEKSDFTVESFSNQAEFLIDSGILEMITPMERDPEKFYKDKNDLLKLTMPSEMGEMFKVMVLGKHK